MKQQSTQTIHLSLGLTQPEHNLIHSPWASIHHPCICVLPQWNWISPCTGSKGRSCSHQESAKPAVTYVCTQHYAYGLESPINFMASSLPANCCSSEPVLWLGTAFSRDVFTKPWRHFCTQQLLNTHWNHIVFSSAASDREGKAKHRPAILMPSSCKNPVCAALHGRLTEISFWIS